MTVIPFQEGTIASHYRIETVPEFILFGTGGAITVRARTGGMVTG